MFQPEWWDAMTDQQAHTKRRRKREETRVGGRRCGMKVQYFVRRIVTSIFFFFTNSPRRGSSDCGDGCA